MEKTRVGATGMNSEFVAMQRIGAIVQPVVECHGCCGGRGRLVGMLFASIVIRVGIAVCL